MSKNVGVSVKCAVFKRCEHRVRRRRERERAREATLDILVINVDNHKSSPGFCEHNKATEEVVVLYNLITCLMHDIRLCQFDVEIKFKVAFTKITLVLSKFSLRHCIMKHLCPFTPYTQPGIVIIFDLLKYVSAKYFIRYDISFDITCSTSEAWIAYFSE